MEKMYTLLFRRDAVQRYWRLREKALKSTSRIAKGFSFHRLHKIETAYNASIPLSTRFAAKPRFPHGLNGIFISSGATIGTDCVIFHQVTIGSNTLEDSNTGCPRIGNNVYIGAGAKIIGNVRVGDNVRIGANCVVVKDVPDNATVVLSAPRVIEHTEQRHNTFVAFQETK